MTKTLDFPNRSPRAARPLRFAAPSLSLLMLLGALVAPALAQRQQQQKVEDAIPFPFKEKDKVALVGSSSTKIGVWPATVEFLFRTRHPELGLTFGRFTTGGGTFATGVENMDKWLADFEPDVVIFNYGGNDAGKGEAGIEEFKKNMTAAVEKAKALGGREVIVMTHQSADARHPKVGAEVLGKRKLYADTMLAHAKEKGWPAVDVHHPLERLQLEGQKVDEAFTILKDSIHLTEPAYVAWGYYLYERLSPPAAASRLVLSAAGEVREAVRCNATDVKATETGLTFTRSDEVLPILPPIELPPPTLVPLAKFSRYMLVVKDLPAGKYLISCEGKPVGVANAELLGRGVNMANLALRSKNPAPWEELAKELWAGKSLEKIGKTSWKFEVVRQE